MNKYLLLLLVILPFGPSYSQVIISNDNSSPEGCAILEIKSGNKGFQPPRLALVSADAATPVYAPTPGLIIYNTASSGTSPNQVCPGLYSWNGSRWVRFDDHIICGYPPLPDNCNPAGTMQDIDGNLYTTIVIGNQEWMAENLKVTKYRDGTVIPNINDYMAWFSLTTGAFSWYDTNTANASVYGALYNWQAVYHDNLYDLCPKGWHVPSNSEWTELIDFLGGLSVAGGKLKETGTSHWQSPNAGAVNSTCFSALPAGWRQNSGDFINLIQGSRYWTSSAMGYGDAWYHGLSYDQGSSTKAGAQNNAGYSVRCIKDCDLLPTQSNAGSDQVDLSGTSAVLHGNAPQMGKGKWSILSGTGGNLGDPFVDTTSFTGLAGNYYRLRWSIFTQCETSSDEVEISFQCPTQPTTASAGPDQLNVQGMSAILQANTPASGTAQWSIVSGYGGNISDVSNPTATFSGWIDHSYILIWTITACSSSSDSVVISFGCPTANAGPDQIDVPGTSTTLQANTPWAGSGLWSLVYGSGGNIATPTDPYSTFSGIIGVNYILKWMITSDCGYSEDNVTISFICSPDPTQANAGPDQGNIAGVTATLQGNTPVNGTGVWTVMSGSNGIIAEPNNPTSLFTGTNGTSYVLRWSISNSCGSTSDFVNIGFSAFSCGNTFQDTRDGHVYTTLTRGSQCWMKENLNYSTGSSTCYAGNPANCASYGRLYDWTTASTACPTGWHLPSDGEWCTLVSGIDATVNCSTSGMTGTNAGGSMKETGYTYWSAPNTGATNSSGFSARGGGSPTLGHNLGQWGDFWTSTQYLFSGNYWSWQLYYADQRIWHNYVNPSNIMSVRCLKN